MEGNKDEAIRCISIAEECIIAGNKDKALKFLYKAEKLYSTQKAKDLIEKATMSKDSSSSIPSSPKCRRRETNETFRTQKRETSEYTGEQITQVERIKKCKDYYEILGVTKEAGDAEIKKAYRKLALMLHPDKNKAPGATEAFKAVGNAFGVLTNPDKRKEYDLLGAEPKTTSRNNKYYEYSRGFEADMSAEDLFNVFFGPGFGAQNTVFMRRNGFWHRPAQEDHQHTRAEEEQAGFNIGSDDYINEQSNFYSSSARDIHNIEYMCAAAYDLGSGNFSYNSANWQHANVWTWGNSIYYKNNFDKSDNLLNSTTMPPQENNDNYNGQFNNVDNTYYNNYIFQCSTINNNNGNASDKGQYYAPTNNGGMHSQYNNNSFYSGSNLFYSNCKNSSASETTPFAYSSFIPSNIAGTNNICSNNGDNVYYSFCPNSDEFNASFVSAGSNMYPTTSSSTAHQNVSSTFYVEPTVQEYVIFNNEQMQGNTVRCKLAQSLRTTSISDHISHPSESQQLREQNCNEELKLKQHLPEDSFKCSAAQQQDISGADQPAVWEQKSYGQNVTPLLEQQIIDKNCTRDLPESIINQEESVNTFSRSFENKLKLYTEEQTVICHDTQQEEHGILPREKHDFKKNSHKVTSLIQGTSLSVAEHDTQSEHSIIVKNNGSYKKQQTPPSSLTPEQKGIKELFASSDDQHYHQNGAAEEHDKIPAETNLSKKERISPYSQMDSYNCLEMNLPAVGAKFFLVKCYFENDIYRSIRYKYWLSRRSDNALLERAYLDSNRSGAIYLFFLVSDPGHLCGMAEMVSSVSYRNGRSKYHTQKGKFNVRWIYVKDIHSQEFKHVIHTVQQLSNVLELSHTKGVQLLKLMHDYKHTTSIFDDFIYYGDLENSRKQHTRTHRTKRK